MAKENVENVDEFRIKVVLEVYMVCMITPASKLIDY